MISRGICHATGTPVVLFLQYNMNDEVNKHHDKPKDIITVPQKEIFTVLPHLGIQSKIVTQQLLKIMYLQVLWLF